jgi:hypothetical protein
MKAKGNGLEVSVELTERELAAVKNCPLRGKIKFTDPYPKPEETGREINFTLTCRKEQRELIELNGKPYWDDKAEIIDVTINNAYYKRLEGNREFEVRYHSGARKFKISITD